MREYFISSTKRTYIYMCIIYSGCNISHFAHFKEKGRNFVEIYPM